MKREQLNKLYGYYLMASYLYYQLDLECQWSDHEYDHVCRVLLDNWDKWDHRLKDLCNKELLAAGSGFSIQSWQYPYGLIDCALAWHRGELKYEKS